MPRTLVLLMLAAGSAPAFAQNTANNAVTQSEDAFGRSVGNERIGIYSNEEVRGFNPFDAGNIRLDSFYIEQGSITSPRLIESSSIKVGYAARGVPFPAPTGIVDLRIEKFTGEQRFNAEIEAETFANVGGSIEGKIPLAGDKLGLAVGAGFREADQVHGRNGSFRNYLVGLSWLPQEGSEVTVFTAGFNARGAEFSPFFFPAGSFVPPRQPRKLQQTQPWAQNRFSGLTSGAIVRLPLAGLKLEAGLFRVTREEPSWFVSLFTGVDQNNRIANTLIIADRDFRQAALSGEVRLSKVWTGEKLRHTLIGSIRGRDQDRRFGGQARISLGASRAGVQDFRSEPIYSLGAKDRSNVRQLFYGLQYNLQSKGGSMISLAAQKATYRKVTDFANAATPDLISRDNPFLFSANGSLAVTPKLNLYAGYVRGMEDSAVAPDIALNRSEAPPALRTRQMDAGLRYAINPHLALIVGVFDIQKPYFGVDAATRFGNLGTVSNKGVEVSLAGTLAKGLTIVAGGILANPRISGPEVDAGRIGRSPVGSFKERAIFNLDWRPGGDSAWSLDLAMEAKAGETADRLNTFEAPGRLNLNLGARYRFAVGDTKMLLRAQMINATNIYGWKVNSSGGFSWAVPRTGYLQLVADF